jgi:hypothetical protein
MLYSWLGGRIRTVISRTERADRDPGDASGWKWAAVRKPDTAAARCKAASLRRSTRGQAGLINSRAATTQNAQKPTPTRARKTRRGDPGGHGSTPVFPKSCQMDLLVKRECRLCPDTFPPIRGKVALRRRTAPRPAVAARRRAKASPLDGLIIYFPPACAYEKGLGAPARSCLGRFPRGSADRRASRCSRAGPWPVQSRR